MILNLEVKNLITRIERELKDAEDFQKNVQKTLTAMKELEDFDYLISLANSIAFNRKMMIAPLQRAAMILELAGLYDQNDDLPSISLIRERLEILKKLNSAQEKGEKETSDTN